MGEKEKKRMEGEKGGTASIAGMSTSHHPKSILSRFGQFVRSAVVSAVPNLTLPLKLADRNVLFANKTTAACFSVKKKKKPKFQKWEKGTIRKKKTERKKRGRDISNIWNVNVIALATT